MPSHENVITLAGRVLGGCPACRGPVRFGENFIRSGRAFVHVACIHVETLGPAPGPGNFPRLAPPTDRGA